MYLMIGTGRGGGGFCEVISLVAFSFAPIKLIVSSAYSEFDLMISHDKSVGEFLSNLECYDINGCCVVSYYWVKWLRASSFCCIYTAIL